MSSAPRYNPHYTVADYLQWSGDWELWSGVAVSMSPSPTRRHQQALFNLAMQVRDGLTKNDQCHCEIIIDVDWRVSDDTVVRPDLSIICAGARGDYIYEPPTLIAEILSPSTARKDLHEKRDLYAHQGVDWYLLIDPDAKTTSVLQLTEQGTYWDVQIAPDPMRIELHERCAFLMDRDKLFN